MIDWKIEQLIRNKFQRGELEGQVPDGWDEDQVVDYFAKYGVPYIMSKGKNEDKVPEWATRLARALDQVEKFILPAIERMNREKRERAQHEARFYRSLDTEEEQKLYSGPTAYPDKYPKPEEETEPEEETKPDETKDFKQMGEKALADEQLQEELEEERKRPKAYPYPPRSKPKEQAGQFPDYTRQNMEKDPQTLARIGLARVTLSSLDGEERREVVREFIKSKDLRFRSGSKRSKDVMPAEGGKLNSVPVQNEDLKRRAFGKLSGAIQRENEAVALEEEAKALPDRIRNLAEKLRKKPLHKWTAQELTEAQKYFTPEQINEITKERA